MRLIVTLTAALTPAVLTPAEEAAAVRAAARGRPLLV